MADLIQFHNPLVRPLHQSGLEVVFFVAMALTLQHAVSRFRHGDRHALFQWLSAVSYGVLLELIAFNYLNNYAHAKFTVQLYRDQLPLYVVFVYPVFHYAGLKLVERWGLALVAEALLAGFTICLIDVPFDVAGVDAKWWLWLNNDPHLAVRWLGVPITSYYWYLLFGGIYAVLCRLLKAPLAKRPFWVSVAVAPLVAVGVVGFGAIAFRPFHLAVAMGVPDGYVVVAHLILCGGVAILVAPAASRFVATSKEEKRIAAIPLLLGLYCLSVIVMLWLRGEVPEAAPLKLLAAVSAVLAAAAMTFGWPSLLRARLGRAE